MSLLRRLLPEARAVSFQSLWGRDFDQTSLASASGQMVTQDRAMRLSAVNACVRLLAETVAGLPCESHYWDDQEIRRLYRPRPRWLDEPNPELTPLEYWERVMASLLLDGNAYSIGIRDDKGDLVQLWPVHPSCVTPMRDLRTREPVYQVHDEETGFNGVLEAQGMVFMLHVRAFGMAGRIKGLSPIEYAKQTIGLGLATEEFGAQWFGDGAHPSSVLESDPVLDPIASLALQATWLKRHNRRRLPAVLSGGLKWKQIQISPEESQFLETRKYTAAQIAGHIYRVPPFMIGEVDTSTSWGTGIEQQSLGFQKFSVSSWTNRLEQRHSKAMQPARAHVRFDIDGLLRGDAKARTESYESGRRAGLLCVDDIRAKEGMPPLPDGLGQIFLEPLDMRRVDDVSLKEKVDAAAALVRAGFEPAAACEAAGLTPIAHTGRAPVTVQADAKHPDEPLDDPVEK